MKSPLSFCNFRIFFFLVIQWAEYLKSTFLKKFLKIFKNCLIYWFWIFCYWVESQWNVWQVWWDVAKTVLSVQTIQMITFIRRPTKDWIFSVSILAWLLGLQIFSNIVFHPRDSPANRRVWFHSLRVELVYSISLWKQW